MNLRRFLQLSGVLCLATLLCSSYLILPIIASSLKNLKNGVESRGFPAGLLLGGVRTIKHHIAETFEKLGHRPNDTILHSVFPEAAELISQKVLKMERCYLSSVKGGVKLDIFTEPLAVIVYRYLVSTSVDDHFASRSKILLFGFWFLESLLHDRGGLWQRVARSPEAASGEPGGQHQGRGSPCD